MQQRVSSLWQAWLYFILAIMLLPCITACGPTNAVGSSSAQGAPPTGKQQSGQDSLAPVTSTRNGQTLYVS